MTYTKVLEIIPHSKSKVLVLKQTYFSTPPGWTLQLLIWWYMSAATEKDQSRQLIACFAQTVCFLFSSLNPWRFSVTIIVFFASLCLFLSFLYVPFLSVSILVLLFCFFFSVRPFQVCLLTVSTLGRSSIIWYGKERSELGGWTATLCTEAFLGVSASF